MTHLRKTPLRKTGLIVSVSALVMTGVAVIPVSAVAAPKVEGVFNVPGIGTNNLIARGPDGNMWVTLQSGGALDKDVARITPAGTVTLFDAPLLSNPVGITTGPDGKLWVTQSGKIGSFSAADPAAATVTDIAAISDPRGIVTGPDGNLWTASDDKVVKIPPADPATFTAYDTATTKVTAARSITRTATAVWVGGKDQVVAIAPDGNGTAYPAGADSSIQGMTAAPSGQVAFTSPLVTPNKIGRLVAGGTPAFTTTSMADPTGIAFGGDGAFWIAQFGAGNLGRLTPAGAYRQLGGFPAGPAKPRQIAAGPGSRLWVTLDAPGEPEKSKVARVTGVAPAPSPSPVPQTTVTKAPKKRIMLRKGKVKALARFRFTSTPTPATFSCRLKRLGNGPVGWKPCTSGKQYRVRKGRYVFSVWATVAGMTDLSPAVRRFRVVPRS